MADFWEILCGESRKSKHEHEKKVNLKVNLEVNLEVNLKSKLTFSPFFAPPLLAAIKYESTRACYLLGVLVARYFFIFSVLLNDIYVFSIKVQAFLPCLQLFASLDWTLLFWSIVPITYGNKTMSDKRSEVSWWKSHWTTKDTTC